jgi:hypothetical protein
MNTNTSIQAFVLTALTACVPLAAQSQDVAPDSIVGRVVKLSYTWPTNQAGLFNVAAYDEVAFRLLSGPNSGLTGTYNFTKTGTNTSLTVLNFLVGSTPVVRSNQSVYATPQSGTFTYTFVVAGQPAREGGGVFEEGLYATITQRTNELVLSWLGGRPPYAVECATNPAFSQWTFLQTVNTNTLTVPAAAGTCVFRIAGRSTSEN